ncbi:MAG TPA: hypothetical protein VG894_10555 [Bauldia sp.]|nr:hypothetical protein [Bauldia sp.]
MNVRISISVALTAITLLEASATMLPVLADAAAVEPGFEDADHDRARDLVEHGEIKPLAEILASVGKAYPGEVVGVRLSGDGQHWQYRIAVLQAGGRRVVLNVDAATMTVIAGEGAP